MQKSESHSSSDILSVPLRTQTRGRLKIFLGAMPGVGKTYAMLKQAEACKAEGVDVVAGLIEPHGLQETEALLSRFEAIPHKFVASRGFTYEELDIDGLLERHPQLVLIDALEHNNVPGGRHPKRYQDVEELLASGIDVYATLNIWHVESLNDVVSRISNMKIRDTVPDKILEMADEIEMIDLPPKELQKRLKAGKVYVPEQSKRAENHLFSLGNLTALRELALRYAAECVDRQMLAYMRARGMDEAWRTRDRLMVCIDNSPGALDLVRSCSRLAERQKLPWLAVYVNNILHLGSKKECVSQAMQLAEELGGETCIITSDNVVKEILSLVRLRHVTRVMIGKPKSKWYRLFSPSVAHQLFQKSDTFELMIAPTEDRVVLERKMEDAPTPKTKKWLDYGVATLVSLVAVIVAYMVHHTLAVSNIALVFLAAVFYVALRSGLLPSIYATIVSLFLYNFFFLEPRYSFSVAHDEHILNLTFFLLVAMVTSRLAAQVRNQVEMVKRNSELTASLYEFSKKIATARDLHSVLRAIVYHVGATLGEKALIMLPQEERLEIVAGFSDLDRESRAAAEWAWRNMEPAGRFCSTMPESPWIFIPMKTESGQIGILGVYFVNVSYTLYADQRHMLFTLAQQAAVVVERAQLAEQIDDAKHHAEAERFRATLLSALSRSFKIPLAEIMGAVVHLQQTENTMPSKEKKALFNTIHTSAEQLARFTQNLLAIIQYDAGILEPKKEKVRLHMIVSAALKLLKKQLSERQVVVTIPEALREFYADPVLLEQAMVNLLEHASKSPKESVITLTAYTDLEAVVIECTDEGESISQEEWEHMADISALDEGADSKGELGLAVCCGIIQAHGGEMQVKLGMNGKGNRIVIRL